MYLTRTVSPSLQILRIVFKTAFQDFNYFERDILHHMSNQLVSLYSLCNADYMYAKLKQLGVKNRRSQAK